MQNLDKLKGEERTRLIVCVGRCAAANFAYRFEIADGRLKDTQSGSGKVDRGRNKLAAIGNLLLAAERVRAKGLLSFRIVGTPKVRTGNEQAN